MILDYGHNPAAVQAMADLVGRARVSSGRRICVLAGPGDRRDEDMREMARIAAKAFDHIILRRDDDLRGRGARRGAAHDGDGAARGRRSPRDQMQHHPRRAGGDRRRRCAWRGAATSLLIFADKISRSWKQVIYFKGAADAAARRAARRSRCPSSRVRASAANVIQDERGVRLARESED